MTRAWWKRKDVVAPVLWLIGNFVALVFTLHSLAHYDFDGLNNLFQFPFAFPWFVLPTTPFLTYKQDAWLWAGYGVLNAVILRNRLGKRTSASRR